MQVSSIHVLYLRVEDLPEAPLMFGRSKCASEEGKVTVMRFNLASSLFTVPHSGLSSQTHCEICINKKNCCLPRIILFLKVAQNVLLKITVHHFHPHLWIRNIVLTRGKWYKNNDQTWIDWVKQRNGKDKKEDFLEWQPCQSSPEGYSFYQKIIP